MADPTYNELVIAMLKAIALERNGFIIPIIREKNTGFIIDGNHRLEVIRRIQADEPGRVIGHIIQDVIEPHPEILAVELNKARRPWNDAEERRTQAQILAKTPVPGGRSGKGGGAKGKPPAGTIAPPSTRQIAAVLGVDPETVRNDLKSTAESSAVPQTPAPAVDLDETAPAVLAKKTVKAEATRQERRNSLRAQCRAAGINDINGKPLYSAGMRAMEAALGITKPVASTTRTKTTTTLSTDSTNGNLEATTAEPEAEIATTDGTEHLNAEQLRDHCAAEVAKSDRPDDYKRAIQLLAELDHIVTTAWRRQHPEPWIAGDWSHVSGELQALHSIAHQRAVELSEAIVQRYTSVTVASSRVA